MRASVKPSPLWPAHGRPIGGNCINSRTMLILNREQATEALAETQMTMKPYPAAKVPDGIEAMTDGKTVELHLSPMVVTATAAEFETSKDAMVSTLVQAAFHKKFPERYRGIMDAIRVGMTFPTIEEMLAAVLDTKSTA